MTEQPASVQFLTNETVALLRERDALGEAFDALGEETRALRAERDELRKHADRYLDGLCIASVDRDHLRGDVRRLTAALEEADLRCEVLRTRCEMLKDALVAVGVCLPVCGCGVSACRRCQALKLRAEALGE